jgi:hypothetical protein
MRVLALIALVANAAMPSGPLLEKAKAAAGAKAKP